MIRINLLPVRQVKKARAGQRQLLLFAGILVAELAVMFVLYNIEASAAEDKRREIKTLQAEIAALKREVGDYEQLQRQRDRLIQQRNVLNNLKASRTGPVWLLRELSTILSVDGRPSLDQGKYDEMIRRNPAAAFNVKWNPRRLWIEKFDERGKTLTIAGKAKDYDDVAELLKRLQVSRHFRNIHLRRNDQIIDKGLGLQVVRFSLTCQVRY